MPNNFCVRVLFTAVFWFAAISLSEAAERDVVAPKIPDALQSVTLNGTELGGEIDRRIRDLVYKNYMVLDIDRDWLDYFRHRTDRGETQNIYYGVGKVIDAGSLFTAYTGDPKVAERTRYLLDEIVKTRDADGYIGFWNREPNDHQNFVNWIVHEQEYFTLAAVRNYRTTGNRASLDAAKVMADHMIQTFPKNKDGVYFIPSPISIAGVAEAALELYRTSGEEKYLDFGEHLQYEPHWFYEPYDEWAKNIPTRRFHLYVMLSHLYPQTELYRLTGDKSLLLKSGWMKQALLEAGHGALLVTGSSSDGEHFTYNQNGAGAVEESCVTAYLLRWFDSLLRLDGDLRIGDIIERAVYNALFAAQEPSGRRICYFTPFTGERIFQTRDTFCCNGNFRRAVAELPQKVYYRTEEGGIALNLFTASDKTFHVGKETVRIKQETEYPTSGEIRLTFTLSAPTEFSFRFRTPRYAEKMTAQISGAEPIEIIPAKQKDGGFSIKRVWKSGDVLTLSIPTEWRFIRGRVTQRERFALLRGPILFEIGKAQNGALFEKFPETRDLVIDPASLGAPEKDDSIRPGGMKVKAEAWTNRERTGEKVDVVFTEFIDPSGRSVYFYLPENGADSPVRVMDDELLSEPRTTPSSSILSACYGPKTDAPIESLFMPSGKPIADLAADYIPPKGAADREAVFPDSTKTGEWSVWRCQNEGNLSSAPEKSLLRSSFKVYETPLGFAYGQESRDGLGFLAEYLPSPNQGQNWRENFTEKVFDQVIPAEERSQYLLTHPVADTASFLVVRWTPGESARGKTFAVAAEILSRTNSNGVSLSIRNNGNDSPAELRTALSGDSQVNAAEYFGAIADDRPLDLVIGNNGSHNSDSTALRFRVYALEKQTAQINVSEKLRERFQGKIKTELGSYNELFGDPAPGVEKTLKIKLRDVDSGVVRYLELPENAPLEL